MKYITYFIKFFYRIRFWLIIAPIIVASLVYWKTNNTPRDYTTTCSIYTGIITGVNILSESGVTMTSYTQGSMMDNLLNLLTADQTLKQVSLRLYARCMVYGDPEKDNMDILDTVTVQIILSLPLQSLFNFNSGNVSGLVRQEGGHITRSGTDFKDGIVLAQSGFL